MSSTVIFKHYILASQEALAKRYLKEKNNLGLVASTPKHFFSELYYHPLFALESLPSIDESSLEKDVRMAEVVQSLQDKNYFKEALKIMGNRKLLMRAFEELRLSGVTEKNIDNLKMDNARKAEGIKTLFKAYCKKIKGHFDYPAMIDELEKRITAGSYDSIFSSIKLSYLSEFEITSREKHLLDLIQKKATFESIEHAKATGGVGALAKFQDYLLHQKVQPGLDLDLTLNPASSISKEHLVYKMLHWMKDIQGSNKDTDVVLLNYDEWAPVFYRLSHELNYPVYLASGIKSEHLLFFTKIMTTLSRYSHLSNEEYLSKAENYLRHIGDDAQENSFRRKALATVKEVKRTIAQYEKAETHIDAHEILLKELRNAKLSAADLEQDESGLWVTELPAVTGLLLQNVAVIGLENSYYPRKKKIDPLLKSEEREEFKYSLGIDINLEKSDLWENLLEKMCENIRGNLFLGYQSHDLSTGKMVVPSSFFNKLLSFTAREVKVENIHLLCGVSESFIDDIPLENPFTPINPHSVLMQNIDEYKKNLYAKEERLQDFGTASEIKNKLSSSSLETFFSCPFAFYLKYHERLQAPEEQDPDLTYWLDATMWGNFLHKVYEELLLPFAGKKTYATSLAQLSEKEIDGIIAKVLDLEEFKDHRPEVSNEVKVRQLEEVKTNVSTFIKNEADNAASGFYPLYLEKEFSITLKAETTDFPFSGRIDRVDTNGKGAFRVLDYKTGKNHFERNKTNLFVTKYKTFFQHGVYTVALKNILKEEKQKISSIEAGYYFTSDKAEWSKVFHLDAEPELEFQKFLEFYYTEAKSMKFYMNSDSCKFCDYKIVCKNEQKVRARNSQIARINLALGKKEK